MGRFVQMSVVAAMGSGLAVAMECPSSGSLVHAGVQVTTNAATSCEKVKGEILARISGESGWQDPHNGGIYTLLSATDSQIKTQRSTNPKTSVGGKVYTDKQTFTLATTSDTSCEIQACSQSQGTSVYDFSTNYCDIHNLYCSDAVCHPLVSFETVESKVSPNLGSGGKDPSKCVPKTESVEDLASSGGMECPSSASLIHAGSKLTATASATCDEVRTEMKARISGANGWKDPHNGGIYSLLSESATQLKTQRTTNPATSVGHKVYTDKQIFTFTDKSDGRCGIQACSQSQGFSIGDFSTNYCDLHNLYCNDAVCNAITSFATVEENVTPNVGSGGKDPSKCVPASAVTIV